MQNRIALVAERFIIEALSSFKSDAHRPDVPSDRSVERLQTQVLLEIVLHLIRDCLICAKIFLRRLRRPLIWFLAGQKVAATGRVSVPRAIAT